MPGVVQQLERLYRKTESWAELKEMLQSAITHAPRAERCAHHCSLGEIMLEHVADTAAATRYSQLFLKCLLCLKCLLFLKFQLLLLSTWM